MGSVVCSKRGRPAQTAVQVIAHLVDTARPLEQFTLAVATPITGYTHQIRSHLAHIGHPLVGDILYGGPVVPWCSHFFLHCGAMGFWDCEGNWREVRAPVPGDFIGALARLRPVERSCVVWCCSVAESTSAVLAVLAGHNAISRIRSRESQAHAN